VEKAIIISYDNLPTELRKDLRQIGANEEAYNGDYINWHDYMAEQFPNLAKWIQENKEIQQFQINNPMCSILLYDSW